MLIPLEFIAKNQLIHFDIKPENILIHFNLKTRNNFKIEFILADLDEI